MSPYVIDPLEDDRWSRFVEKHPAASAFHTRGWLTALHKTYVFEPAVITTSPAGTELSDGIVFCRIRSWMTGRRLVSLPFSDHCSPLVDEPENLQILLESLRQVWASKGWDYLELRPLTLPNDEKMPGFAVAGGFAFHTLDLRPPLEQIAASFHKDCVLRKIRRAERDGLVCEEGRSKRLLRQFYALQLRTRRRQNFLPQPYRWFNNLVESLGERLTIWAASLEGRAIASIITIHEKKTILYKYGCSDEKYNAHGGTQLLFWNMIRWAKGTGLEQLDMGRSDTRNQGLIKFKERWGGMELPLNYLMHPGPESSAHRYHRYWIANATKMLAAVAMGLPISRAAAFLYRHFA